MDQKKACLAMRAVLHMILQAASCHIGQAAKPAKPKNELQPKRGGELENWCGRPENLTNRIPMAGCKCTLAVVTVNVQLPLGEAAEVLVVHYMRDPALELLCNVVRNGPLFLLHKVSAIKAQKLASNDQSPE